jgi:hypothetical protein
MSRNRKVPDQRYYIKKRIEKKIKSTITKQNDSKLGYYHFKNVLSSDAIDRCNLELPKGASMLEPRRFFFEGTKGIDFDNDNKNNEYVNYAKQLL